MLPNIQQVEQTVQNFATTVSTRRALLDDKVKNLAEKEVALLQVRGVLDLYNKTSSFLNSFSSSMREGVRQQVEELVTRVLVDVMHTDRYSFRIQFQEKRGTQEADYGVWHNKKKKFVELMNSSGGGIADIVSTTLFFAFLQITNPASDYLILDEVGKNISVEYRDSFFRLIKELVNRYHKQIIYVTHQTELTDVADKVVRFELGEDEYTVVK